MNQFEKEAYRILCTITTPLHAEFLVPVYLDVAHMDTRENGYPLATAIVRAYDWGVADGKNGLD